MLLQVPRLLRLALDPDHNDTAPNSTASRSQGVRDPRAPHRSCPRAPALCTMHSCSPSGPAAQRASRSWMLAILQAHWPSWRQCTGTKLALSCSFQDVAYKLARSRTSLLN